MRRRHVLIIAAALLAAAFLASGCGGTKWSRRHLDPATGRANTAKWQAVGRYGSSGPALGGGRSRFGGSGCSRRSGGLRR